MSDNPIRIKNRTIGIINTSYNVIDGEVIYKEVQKIIILSIFPEEMMAGGHFVHFFIRQLAPAAALSDISLVDLARKLKLILGEFETDIYGKNDAVHFIHRLLLRKLRNENSEPSIEYIL